MIVIDPDEMERIRDDLRGLAKDLQLEYFDMTANDLSDRLSGLADDLERAEDEVDHVPVGRVRANVMQRIQVMQLVPRQAESIRAPEVY